MPAVERTSLLDRLQAQVTRLDREAVYLRQVDKTMQARLHAAVEEADRAKRVCSEQATTILDLRRQLEARTTELALLRAEIDAERAARPAPKDAPVPKDTDGTRFGLLEVD